jgi:hypothetical protein
MKAAAFGSSHLLVVAWVGAQLHSLAASRRAVESISPKKRRTIPREILKTKRMKGLCLLVSESAGL